VELHNGDSLTQREFHILYEQMPEGFRAELIDGTVYVCEPTSNAHGVNDGNLIGLLTAYRNVTPGVEVSVNATVILCAEDEVQPDVMMRIDPRCGGQTGDSYPKF
jgi:Uma2 family endonuclease